jgi:IS30 family transposase
MPEQERWLTVAAAAHQLGKSVDTIERYIRRDGLTTLLGRVREADVIASEERARSRMRAGKRTKDDKPKDWLETLADTYGEVAGLDEKAKRDLRDFAKWAAPRGR